MSDEIVTMIELENCSVTIYGPWSNWNKFQPWSRIILSTPEEAEVYAQREADKHKLKIRRLPIAGKENE